MPISVGIYIWKGDASIPNRRYTISCVRTREQLGRVRFAETELDGANAGAMYGAGHGRVGVGTA